MNRRFILRARPGAGAFDPAVLARDDAPRPQPGPGQALVQNLYLSLDPSNRIWMGEGESYMPPVPLGAVMRGAGLARVIASNTPNYRVGQKVLGLTGWQDYALISPQDEYPCQTVPGFLPVPDTTLLGALGITGITAYFGVTDIGKPKRGETFVVSAAAGAVGSVAGQIAKIFGARVVGIAGTREKCDWLVRELGFDAAICRRDADWRAQLRAACPNGIDVDFENAGGEIMEAVFDLLNLNARVVLCGLISQYGTDGEGIAPRNFRNLLTRRVRVQGFIVLDYLDRIPRASLKLAWWMWRGRLKDRNTVLRGFDRLPEALGMLFTGDNTGKLIVALDPPA